MSAGPGSDTVELESGLAEAEQGPRTLAPFGRRACPVVTNEAVGAYRLIGIDDPTGPAPCPGQFYMLSTATGWGSEGGRPHLGRAFSVCRVRDRRLEFLLEAIGPGTDTLAALSPGEAAWIVGPLGIGFTPPVQDGRAVLVGGGIGIAPLAIWAETLHGQKTPTVSLLGFRSAHFAAAAALIPGDRAVATDDGTTTAGGERHHHGLITDLLPSRLSPADVVYACGPPPMLEAVRRICMEREVPGQLAMEAGMACGFGACFGCVVRTRRGYRRLCVDGPVVAAVDLAEDWE